MTIALPPDQDLSKVVTSLATARLLGFSTAGRKSTEAPSRRIIALALGLATGDSAASRRQRRADRGCRVEAFAAAVNLALATHGPRNLRYLATSAGQLAWDDPAWTLPTAYRVTFAPTADDDGVLVGTGTIGVVVGRRRLTYRVRAQTRVGAAQAADITIEGLAAVPTATTATAHEGGGNARNALSVVVTGTTAPWAQVLWARRNRAPNEQTPFSGVWTTNFRTATPPGEQRRRAFALDVPYDGNPGHEIEDVPIRCYVAQGRPPTFDDYDVLESTTMRIINEAAA